MCMFIEMANFDAGSVVVGTAPGSWEWRIRITQCNDNAAYVGVTSNFTTKHIALKYTTSPGSHCWQRQYESHIGGEGVRLPGWGDGDELGVRLVVADDLTAKLLFFKNGAPAGTATGYGIGVAKGGYRLMIGLDDIGDQMTVISGPGASH